MHALNSTVEVERLYDELREAIRANDQDGTQRIMAELVRAKRPLAEIVGEVKRLSRESAGPESGAEPAAADDWQSDIAPQSVQPSPESISEPSYTHFASASAPPLSPPIPSGT